MKAVTGMWVLIPGIPGQAVISLLQTEMRFEIGLEAKSAERVK